SQSGTPAHLGIAVAAGLAVARELDRAPTCEVGVTAVLGRTVRTLARVHVEERAQFGLRTQPAVLLGILGLDEVFSQRRDAVSIDLLPAARRAVELAFRDAERAFDARAPGDLFVARQRQEPVERRRTAGAAAERTAREDQRRIECERAEQPVDVVGDTER